MYEIEPLQKRLTLLSKPSEVRAVAALAGVSEKTVIRVKAGENSPSLKTASALMAAIESFTKGRKAKRQKAEA